MTELELKEAIRKKAMSLFFLLHPVYTSYDQLPDGNGFCSPYPNEKYREFCDYIYEAIYLV